MHASINTVPDPRGRTVRQEVELTVDRGLGQSRAHPVSPVMSECCYSDAPSPSLSAYLRTSLWWRPVHLTEWEEPVVSQVCTMFRAQ